MSEDQDPVVKVKEDERKIKDPARGTVPKADLHTHWARDKSLRIQHLKNKGYRIAKLTDVEELSVGFAEGETIRNLDTVLMVAPRAEVEARELARQREVEEIDRRSQKKLAEEGELVTDEEHHGQKRRGKFYSLP